MLVYTPVVTSARLYSSMHIVETFRLCLQALDQLSNNDDESVLACSNSMFPLNAEIAAKA
jgi:hypothetical protein